MTDKKNYPEEIYKDAETGGEHFIPRFRETFEKAYDLGYQHGQQDQRDLTGWSNLTEAIQAGERIDWEALDGLEAKCVHPELGALTHKMERDPQCPPDGWAGWGTRETEITHWDTIFECAWAGSCGWSLWIKGDLPLRKQTADQLKPGTCFAARHNKGEYTQSYSYAQLVKADGQKPMVVCYSRYLTGIFATIDPKEVEVIDIYGEGTFEKPEGDA